MTDRDILKTIISEIESDNFKYYDVFDDDFIVEIGENMVVYMDIIDNSFEVLEHNSLIGFYNKNNASVFDIANEYQTSVNKLISCIDNQDIMNYLKEIEMSHVELENYMSANKYKLIIDKLCQ